MAMRPHGSSHCGLILHYENWEAKPAEKYHHDHLFQSDNILIQWGGTNQQHSLSSSSNVRRLIMLRKLRLKRSRCIHVAPQRLQRKRLQKYSDDEFWERRVCTDCRVFIRVMHGISSTMWKRAGASIHICSAPMWKGVKTCRMWWITALWGMSAGKDKWRGIQYAKMVGAGIFK